MEPGAKSHLSLHLISTMRGYNQVLGWRTILGLWSIGCTGQQKKCIVALSQIGDMTSSLYTRIQRSISLGFSKNCASALWIRTCFVKSRGQEGTRCFALTEMVLKDRLTWPGLEPQNSGSSPCYGPPACQASSSFREHHITTIAQQRQ
jgi:hypothetical protein